MSRSSWSVWAVTLWAGLASAQSYNSVTDFSATQGANQWSYLDGSGTPMIYDGMYAGGAWHSVTPAGGDWCYVSSDQQHPGNNTAANDSIRRWTAPHGGTVTIVGSSMMKSALGGDGAFVTIRRNGGQLFRGLVAPFDTTVGQRWSLTSPVAAGDTIDTVINRNGFYTHDEQKVTQTITYQDQFGPDEQVWSIAFYGDRGTTFADVTGDGRADAIALTTNAAVVRRSSGSSFGPAETWSWDATFPYRGILFGDVNGDGRADMVRIESMSVDVRLSTGTGFAPSELWTYSPFIPGTVQTTLADVTGDGAADLISIDENAVRVRASAPLASRFIAQAWWSTAPRGWRSTHFADLNADGMADVIYVDNTGIRVGLSDGYELVPGTWSTDVNPQGELVFADVDGDRRADAIVLGSYYVGAKVRRARSADFGPIEAWTPWPFYGTRGTFVADISGDIDQPRADLIAVTENGIVVRRASEAFGAIDPPSTAGYAFRLSTFDLRGPQASTSATFDAALNPTSTVPGVDRVARANPATIVAHFVSTGPKQPQQLWILGSIRTSCEGLRNPQGQPGVDFEISVPFFKIFTATTPKPALSFSTMIDPNQHGCQNAILRSIRVDAQAFAWDSVPSLLAISSPIAFTLVRSLKVMTWNIQGAYAVHTPDDTILDIADLINEEQVDVVGLQEVHVNFQPASNFIDELSILRSRLIGLPGDTYKARCTQRSDSLNGLAMFSRLPIVASKWEEYGFVRTSCAGGFNKYNELHGTQSITVALGDTSLVVGNTHWPLRLPWGFTDMPTALAFLEMLNSTAIESSPLAYLMGGDFNAGTLTPRVSRADLVPGVLVVNLNPPTPPGFIDHMFFKSMTTTTITPVETYFRDWGAAGVLSDHTPRVTIYNVE